MSTNKTTPTTVDPQAFLASVAHAGRREDCQTLAALLERLTGAPPVMWGPTIVGFGTRHYRYASGREGDTARVGFAPRQGSIVLYGLLSDDDGGTESLERLGPHRRGRGCLYVKRLGDIDVGVLEQLVATAWSRPD